MNVLRNLTVSVALYSKIATSSHFRKINFFWKTHLFFQNSSNFLKFLRNLTNRVAFCSKPASISNFWKLQVFFSENASFLAKKPNFWKFWEILLFRSHSTSNWLTSTVFKKFKFFSEKNVYCFEKPNVLTFWKTYCFGGILHQICYHQHFLMFSRFFFGKPIFFCKNPNFECF